jgi:hypothetical protein
MLPANAARHCKRGDLSAIILTCRKFPLRNYAPNADFVYLLKANRPVSPSAKNIFLAFYQKF